MTWAVTADVQRFDSAVEWFGKRVVISAETAQAIEGSARSRAFWIGGGLQLTQVQRVFDSLNTAIADGTSFENWRAKVRGDLVDAQHAQVVFRNATQRAYNAGRWQEMMQPDVVAFRPFGLVDAILDGRTTTYCREQNGTCVPLSDDYWLTHWYPAHHQCRTSVRNLTKAQAAKRLKPPPQGLDPPEGWGQAPVHDPVWQPKPDKHDKKLLETLTKKERAKKPRRAPPAHHEPAHWVDHYRALYPKGRTAEVLASGRAALERGLDMTVEKAREALKPLTAFVGPLDVADALEGHKATATLREIGGEIDPALRAAAGLAGHVTGIKIRPSLLIAGITDDEGLEALEFMRLMTDESLSLPVNWNYVKAQGRAFCNPQRRVISYGTVDDLTHEMSHAIEAVNPKTGQAAIDFLRARTEHLPVEKLSKWLGPAYADIEVGNKDSFVNAYIGKNYNWRATEVTSVGVEILTAGSTPGADLLKWLREDPEHFLFTLGQLAGA
jgi:SPP1 gp7 family putative phage head morphogenesis protein